MNSRIFYLLLFCYCCCCCCCSTIAAELKIIKKSDWNGEEAINILSELQLPVERVIIMHTASLDCDDEETCKKVVRQIQSFHMTSFSFDDIAYNFLIGNDGNVYEGRGWSSKGAFAKGFNEGSIGIAFIGTFQRNLPNETALDATRLLIEEGIKLGKIAETYKLVGHRQVAATVSPGDALYQVIKQWPHWSRVA